VVPATENRELETANWFYLTCFHHSVSRSVCPRLDLHRLLHLSPISRELLRLERQTAVRLRNEGRINDETLRQLEHELDLREADPGHA
jgi:hypothetical protein